MNQISIIVSSCDAFRDCWEPFVFSLTKYWPDLPYKIYIVSNYQSIDDEKVKFIKVGEDKGWASNLKVALNEINTEYVLYLQEDYWLTSPVNTIKFISQINYCINMGIDYLRLNFPYNDKYKKDNEHAECCISTDKYALCLQVAIWKKDTLMKLLVDGWSGWDYEAKVCRYSIEKGIPVKAEVVLSNADDIIIHYIEGTAVRKGKWTLSGALFLKANGYDSLIPKRETEGWLISHLSIWRNNVFCHYPSSAILRFLNKLKWNV